MAWRNNLLLIALVIGLSACTFPIQVSFSSPGTPEAEPKEMSPITTESPETLGPEITGNENILQTVRFIVQPGTPVGVVNFVDPSAGCNWMGVGGQVFGLDAEPVVDLIATVGGNLAGKQVSQLAVTGEAQALGPGGFLIPLGNQPEASQGTLWLQLFDQDGLALSDKVFFNTYAGCDRNLILINFTERFIVQTTSFLPFVGNQKLYYYFPFVGQR